MKEFIGWTDVLVCKTKTGEFVLFRNYVDPGGSYFFSTYEKLQDSNNESLYTQEPIAIGISAFFAKDFNGVECLRKKIETRKKFKTNEVFLTYLNFFLARLKSENEMAVKPNNEEVIIQDFLENHLSDEKRKFLKSEFYYKEVSSRRNEIVRDRLQDYAKGYFNWIEEQISQNSNRLTSQTQKGQSLVNPNLNLSDVLVHNVKPESVKNLYYESRGEDGSTKYLTMFLRHLQDKGYYKRKLTLNELGLIGVNDFSETFKLHRKYVPPTKNTTAYFSYPYNKIPLALDKRS